MKLVSDEEDEAAMKAEMEKQNSQS
jgi:hypothetical protein